MSIIVEFVGGKVTASIERLIALYRPDSLVVGTRGQSVLQQWGAAFGAPGVGSISRYVIHSLTAHCSLVLLILEPDIVSADPRSQLLSCGMLDISQLSQTFVYLHTFLPVVLKARCAKACKNVGPIRSAGLILKGGSRFLLIYLNEVTCIDSADWNGLIPMSPPPRRRCPYLRDLFGR